MYSDRLSERVLVSTVREVVFIAKTIPPRLPATRKPLL
jgi:hypothetical protein